MAERVSFIGRVVRVTLTTMRRQLVPCVELMLTWKELQMVKTNVAIVEIVSLTDVVL